jgi:hypothetical protein
MFAAYDEYENLELVAGSLQFGTLRILNPEMGPVNRQPPSRKTGGGETGAYTPL